MSDFVASALQPYSVYCSAFANADVLMQLAKENPKWDAFQKSVEAHPRLRGRLLAACMIKPIQRWSNGRIASAS
jgi:hypothetical protein